MSSLKELFNEINNLCANLKKSKNRRAEEFGELYVENKIAKLNRLKNSYLQIFDSTINNVEIENKNKYFEHKNKFLEIYEEITLLINEIKVKIDIYKMSDFKFETGLKLPILQDDKEEMLLRDFLDTVESYWNLLNAEGKKELIKFVCLNKIQGKAKTKLGNTSLIDTFDKLKLELRSRCGIQETLESLYIKLGSARQGRKTLTEFVDELDLITSRIASLEIKEQKIADADQEIVRLTLKSQALRAFKRGVHDELKVVVEAARPKTLEDALGVATSSVLNKSNRNAEVNYFYHGNRRFRNNKFRGNYRGRGYNQNNNQNWNNNQGNQNNNNSGTFRSKRGRGHFGKARNRNKNYKNSHERNENKNVFNIEELSSSSKQEGGNLNPSCQQG